VNRLPRIIGDAAARHLVVSWNFTPASVRVQPSARRGYPPISGLLPTVRKHSETDAIACDRRIIEHATLGVQFAFGLGDAAFDVVEFAGL